MQKQLLSFLLLLPFVICSAQKTSFYVSGTGTKTYKGNIILVVDGKSYKAYADNDKFEFKGKADLPVVATLKTEEGDCGSELVLDAKDVSVSVSILSPQLAAKPCIIIMQTSGGDLQNDYNSIANLSALKQTTRSLQLYNDSLRTRFEKALSKHRDFGFIAQALYRENVYLSAETLDAIVSKFGPAQKETKYYASLLSVIEQKKKFAIGNTVDDFQQMMISGKIFSLASLRGKYVLIDFWASWCKPCRVESPNLVKMYDRYHNSGFEIVSISLDTDEESWKKAAIDDKLNWIHTSDLQGWQNAVSKKFLVTSIPFNVLIDPAGKIAATNLKGAALEAKLRSIFTVE